LVGGQKPGFCEILPERLIDGKKPGFFDSARVLMCNRLGLEPQPNLQSVGAVPPCPP